MAHILCAWNLYYHAIPSNIKRVDSKSLHWLMNTYMMGMHINVHLLLVLAKSMYKYGVGPDRLQPELIKEIAYNR